MEFLIGSELSASSVRWADFDLLMTCPYNSQCRGESQSNQTAPDYLFAFFNNLFINNYDHQLDDSIAET